MLYGAVASGTIEVTVMNNSSSGIIFTLKSPDSRVPDVDCSISSKYDREVLEELHDAKAKTSAQNNMFFIFMIESIK